MELITFAEIIGVGYAAYYASSILADLLSGKKSGGRQGPIPAVRIAYESEGAVKVETTGTSRQPESATIETDVNESREIPPCPPSGYLPRADRGNLPADLGLETITPAGIDVTAGALRELLMDTE